MSEAIRWWLILLLAGAVTLPLCLAAFRRLPDRGYTLARPFGLLFLGYTFWFLNSIRVLPNHRGGIIGALLLLGVISGIFAWRDRDDLRAWFERRWSYVLGVEIAFLYVFMMAVWLRSFVGNIEFTEQPMDLMFVTANYQASHFPPQDPWLAGQSVAYYYFGYVMIAMVGKLAAVPAEVAYNLGFAMTAALALIGGFGVVYNLVRMREDVVAPDEVPPEGERATFNWKPAAFGIGGAFMLVVMGNLTWVLKFASAYGIGGSGFYSWLNVQGISARGARDSWYPSDFFGFFSGSRIMPLDRNGGYTITEWPMFSFVLGDLHPHVMALPFVLLAAGLALALYRSDEPLDIVFWLRRPLLLVASAIIVGALGFINTWDIATMSFVVVAAALVSNFGRTRRVTVDLGVQIVSFALPLLVLAGLLFIPFYASFSSQASGLLPVTTNAGVTVPGTRPVHLLLHWGPLFAVVVPFVALRLFAARERISRVSAAVAAAVPVGLLFVWLLLFAWNKARDNPKLAGAGNLFAQIGDRGSGWLTALILAVLLSGALLALWLELTSDDERDERTGVLFALLLAAMGFLLIFGTEFFYVGDLFNSRMNTVFKLYYQAWLLLAMAGGFALYYLAARWPIRFRRETWIRAGWGGLVAIVLAGAALYPLGATFNRTDDFKAKGDLHGLAGFSPEEQQAFAWLRGLSQGQEVVIAEAVGGDYWTTGKFSRVSMATGAPTIMGWQGHENQWRGQNSPLLVDRFGDVEALFEGDVNTVARIVEKYNVTYIWVGQVEKLAYGEANLAKFKDFTVAKQFGDITIYNARQKSAAGEASTP